VRPDKASAILYNAGDYAEQSGAAFHPAPLLRIIPGIMYIGTCLLRRRFGPSLVWSSGITPDFEYTTQCLTSNADDYAKLIVFTVLHFLTDFFRYVFDFYISIGEDHTINSPYAL
jgi:hypothetical protein